MKVDIGQEESIIGDGVSGRVNYFPGKDGGMLLSGVGKGRGGEMGRGGADREKSTKEI